MVRCQRLRHDPFNPSPCTPIIFPIRGVVLLIAVLHPEPQGFRDVFPADFQSAPSPDHKGRGVMHAYPVLRLILEPPDHRGISRFDFPQGDAFPRGLSFDRRQQGPVIKLVRHAVKLGADIPIMDELQVFHDQSRSTSLRPLNSLDRETSHQRVASIKSPRLSWLDGGPE